MAETAARGQRRTQILQAFAAMLETNPGGRITTAALAREVGVSEAALYRHFPSKARMFEGLIEFMEETLFSRIRKILDEEPQAPQRCEATLSLLLAFVERNPGFARLLTGDALSGETDRLRARIRQLFDRIETQLRTILREAEQHGQIRAQPGNEVAANLMLACAAGRISQFVRTNFSQLPTADWPAQWNTLARGIFDN